MKNRKIFGTLIVTLGVLALSLPTWAALRVGLVLDKGGKDDKSFNSSAYAGLEKAKKELGVTGKFVEAKDDQSYAHMLRSFARKDFDLIIAIGFAQAEMIDKVAQQFPKKHFLLVDGEAQAPNIKSVLFAEHEGSYLVGAIAALTSKGHKYGIIGGVDIPLIRRFSSGFEAGVKKIDSQAQVKLNFIGVTGDAWRNPAQAKEFAKAQYDEGAEVIFAVAGASNMGVFDAAEEAQKKAIGCDSNQNWVKPGLILTSMMKRVDVAVFKAIEEMSKGEFKPGLEHLGLAAHGVDYAVDEHNRKLLPPEVIKKVEALRAQIISGKILVPSQPKPDKST